MKAKVLIAELTKKLKTTSQKSLASALGITTQTLRNWQRDNTELSPSKVASAVAKARASAIKRAQLHTITPLVEFYPLERVDSRHAKCWNLFPFDTRTAKSYALGLKERLEKAKGIYIFYDSQGRALYVGKAGKSLWMEMNSAFNRKRNLQKITLVSHPDRNQDFQTGVEKKRQPKPTPLVLADLAEYFSAYEVDPGMIGDLEALLVRGFANDLLNIRMETFLRSRA